jgi:hypothetical protein
MSMGTSPISSIQAPFVGRDAAVRVSRMGHHRPQRREVDRMDAAGVLGVGVGRDGARFQTLDVDPGPPLGQPAPGLVVGDHDRRLRRALGGHVGQRGPLVHR